MVGRRVDMRSVRPDLFRTVGLIAASDTPFVAVRADWDGCAGSPTVQLRSLAFQSESWAIVAKREDYVLASWQQVFAVIWRRETTLVGATHLRSACKDFARRHPRGIGLLTIVAENAPLPPSAARNEVAAFLAEGSAFIKCSAVVFEGSGFRAAAVRSVVTGLTLLAKQAYPHKVCDMQDAIEMFARVLPRATGHVLDASTLRLSLDELRMKAEI